MAKSDVAALETLRQDLIKEAGVLEDVPDRLKYWRPGSDRMVLDLLDPSMFPLRHGQSRALPVGRVPLNECAKFIGLGEIIPAWCDDADLQWRFGALPLVKPWPGLSGCQVKST